MWSRHGPSNTSTIILMVKLDILQNQSCKQHMITICNLLNEFENKTNSPKCIFKHFGYNITEWCRQIWKRTIHMAINFNFWCDTIRFSTYFPNWKIMKYCCFFKLDRLRTEHIQLIVRLVFLAKNSCKSHQYNSAINVKM